MYEIHKSKYLRDLISLPRWSGVPFPLLSALAAVATVDTFSAAASLDLPLSLRLDFVEL